MYLQKLLIAYISVSTVNANKNKTGYSNFEKQNSVLRTKFITPKQNYLRFSKD